MTMRALLQALLATVTATTSVPPETAPQSETLALSRDLSARMTLPAQVNGRGPYRFTIDTGADRSVVSDQLASELGLVNRGQATVFGILGPLSVTMVALDQLRIGRREHRTLEAPVLPLDALGAAGLIGLDALANESVLFDFKHNRVTIARSNAEAMIGDPSTIVVTGKSKFGELILTDASINGVKVYAIIDTGAENTIGNLALRKLMGRSGPLDDKGARVIGVTGGELPAESGNVPHIRLGALQLNNMPVAYADIATFRKFGVDHRPSILLGMDVLRGFDRVAVDFRRREVRFDVGESPFMRVL